MSRSLRLQYTRFFCSFRWRHGVAVASLDVSAKLPYTLSAVSTGMDDRLPVGKSLGHVTSHPGQLSLLPSARWELSTECNDVLRRRNKGNHGSYPQQNKTIENESLPYNWHSAGSLGWPFPMLKYKYIFQIYGSNFIKRLSETVIGLKLPKC